MSSSSISLQRRVQWLDTDAGGIWHHSLAYRWAEEAEAELHRRLGIIDETFGATPRVRTEFEFAAPVRFGDVVDITFTVAALGSTSMTYEIDFESGSTPVAWGRIVVVFIDRASGEKRIWPESLRRALVPGG